MSKTIVEYGSDNLVDATKALAEKDIPNYEIVVADEKRIQLDLDDVKFTDPLPDRFQTVYRMLCQGRGNIVAGYYRTQSKSGNTHVTIRLLKSMPVHERIAWQAIFGSDYKREALHMMAVRADVKNAILMFEPKDRSEELEGIPPPDVVPSVGRFFRDEVAE